MENQIGILFETIHIPRKHLIHLYNIYIYIIVVDCSKCTIEINTKPQNKLYRFNYPQTSPFQLPFYMEMYITILQISNQKYKKIAKGKITFTKKDIVDQQQHLEKSVQLNLVRSTIENMGNKPDTVKNELNNGKAIVKVSILDINAIKRKLTTAKPQQIQEQIYDDDLSDLSISIIDQFNEIENEETKDQLDIKTFTNNDYLLQLKQLLDKDYIELLPKDIDKLKQLNEVLYAKYTELSKNYNDILTAINNESEQMRSKAQFYFDKYKEMKTEINKGRIELKDKQRMLNDEQELNDKESKIALDRINHLRGKIGYLKMQMNIDNNNNVIKNEDNDNNKNYELMASIIHKLNNAGVQVFNGLNKDEQETIKRIADIEEDRPLQQQQQQFSEDKKESGNEGVTQQEEEEGDDVDEDPEIVNQIISLIENDVNLLFLNNRIQRVTIDQQTGYEYTFTSDTCSKDVTLQVVNDHLELANNTLLGFLMYLL